ncbi:hypothetical protein AACH06_09595 [Ideonella sp. DXS29W]|uniref:Uncharacterized protein n=1 Tax=Ideonella lacteola TaxID=2984193 RepID=A0ABU9BNN6_9BURK
MTSPAIHLAARLRLPPFLPRLPVDRPTPRGWPAWLPPPANRPDDVELQAHEDRLVSLDDVPAALAVEPMLPSTSAVGGWYDSSLDLRLGLEVQDLGPVEWLDEWDGAFA